MIEKKYKKYVEIRAQIAALEEDLQELSEELKKDILSNNGDLVETKYGNFYLTRRKKWKYTNAVSVLESEVKERKKLEEDKGFATEVDETVSLAFRGKKI